MHWKTDFWVKLGSSIISEPSLPSLSAQQMLICPVTSSFARPSCKNHRFEISAAVCPAWLARFALRGRESEPRCFVTLQRQQQEVHSRRVSLPVKMSQGWTDNRASRYFIQLLSVYFSRNTNIREKKDRDSILEAQQRQEEHLYVSTKDEVRTSCVPAPPSVCIFHHCDIRTRQRYHNFLLFLIV